MNIDWESDKSHQLINQAFSPSVKDQLFRIQEAACAYPGHIWLATSGSVSQKWVGLSKKAILVSASQVNRHLESEKMDRWVNALPLFHVGGLGIYARAHLSGAAVYNFAQELSGKWNAEAFYHYVEKVKGTLTSLVPAQLYDLIAKEKPPPPSLRACIIGGGHMLLAYYEKAAALGWPLLLTYGSTECASQVASSQLCSVRSLDYPPLQLLPHITAKVTNERLSFFGPSLLSAYAFFENERVAFVDPKIGGWWESEDRGVIQGNCLQILGRSDAIVKIGGESVDVFLLENLLQSLRKEHEIQGEATLLAMPDARLGMSLHLASDSSNREEILFLADRFREKVLPFERIRQCHFVEKLPRSSLGKILKRPLQQMVKEISSAQ